jgi:hypothetical protein
MEFFFFQKTSQTNTKMKRKKLSHQKYIFFISKKKKFKH